jgi:peptide/nickel transport system permease protein
LNLLTFVARRLLFAIFVLLGVMTITFILAHSIGGNPIYAWLGKSAGYNPKLVAAFTQEYHLSDPLYVQYYYYVLGLLHGDLGYSPSRGFVPVTTVIAQTLPYTVQIAFFAVVISISLGVLSALYSHRKVDKTIRSFYLAGISSPPFFMALLLLIVFSFEFRLLPTGGPYDHGLELPNVVTGIPMLDALIQGDLPFFWSSLQHVILPSLALALGTFGVITRVLRSSMLDVMHANFIRTLRAKGLDERTIFFKHGLRNALIPVVTLSSIIVTWLITGTIFVENIFSYPGMGQFVFQSVAGQDYPGILGSTLVFAVIIVATNLVADVLYAVVDPEIRMG